ncbi:MAG: UDP-N-acetylglucosamine 2-epimerase (non-hydrolyzing) [Thermoleophilaceae bacterium]
MRERHEELIVHTGQHYDDELSGVFFEELGVPRPDRLLGVGGGSASSQNAGRLVALEPELASLEPNLVLVYGDTNSTLAGALAAAQSRIPVVHVEAGMRSFDRSMPEELNRVLCDHISELNLCSTDTAVANLAREGIERGVHLVGDTMADVTLAFAPVAERQSRALERNNLEAGRYLLATAHRAGNVDDPGRLAQLVDLLLSLPETTLFTIHPRTRAQLERTGLMSDLDESPLIIPAPPLGYLDFLTLTRNARAVLTDSGGVQKEAYLLGTPCITLRERTEWIETVDAGWNVLVGLDSGAALAALDRAWPTAPRPELYGGGRAGARICDLLDAYTADG